jgi:formyl-CoA transferase
VEVPHPERGSFVNVGCPLKLSDSPVEVRRSPLLGEHTEEIVREVLAYTDEHIENLRDAGAFSKEPPKAGSYHPLRA